MQISLQSLKIQKAAARTLMSRSGPNTNPSELRIRQRLIETAIEELAVKGYDDSLLERVAEKTGCGLEAVATFFQSNEDLLLALYSRFAADLESRVDELPNGTLADRFRALMHLKFELMSPYRQVLNGLEGVIAGRREQPGVLSPGTEHIRRRVQAIMAETAEGASDRGASGAEFVAQSLYSAYLALMWFWFRDPSGRKAERVLNAACRAMSFSAPRMSSRAVRLPLKALGAVQQVFIQKDPTAEAAAAGILKVLFEHRRLLPEAGGCASDPCARCRGAHVPKAAYFASAGRPIHMILPAFPAKSPNRRKTLGPRPDMAEEQALLYLARVSEKIRKIYAPGIRLTICSDGHVFSDLVGVSDDDVSSYGEELARIIKRLGLDDTIDTFSLTDLYERIELAEMRRQMNLHYEQSLESLRERSARSPQAASLVNGIQRFLFEDQVALDDGRSRTQVRNDCRSLAYRVVQRSDGWGRLLSDCFPMALRLSIHPQGPHSDKIGILLGESEDVWLTPWHSVAVKRGDRFVLMKRHDAEACGARLSGKGGYYEI